MHAPETHSGDVARSYCAWSLTISSDHGCVGKTRWRKSACAYVDPEPRKPALRPRQRAVRVLDPRSGRPERRVVPKRCNEDSEGALVEGRVRVEEEDERGVARAPADVAAGGEAGVVGTPDRGHGEIGQRLEAPVGRRVVDDDHVDILAKGDRGDAIPQVSAAVVRDDDDVHQGHVRSVCEALKIARTSGLTRGNEPPIRLGPSPERG